MSRLGFECKFLLFVKILIAPQLQTTRSVSRKPFLGRFYSRYL